MEAGDLLRESRLTHVDDAVAGTAGAQRRDEGGHAGGAGHQSGEPSAGGPVTRALGCVRSRYPRDLESRSKRGLGGGTTAGLADSRWRTMAAVLTTETSIEARPRSSARTREMRSR